MPVRHSPPPLSLVILADGLSPRYLAPYGCTWTSSPAFDRLAAESIVFENAIADSVDNTEALAAFFSGCSPLAPVASDGPTLQRLTTVRQRATSLFLSDTNARPDALLGVDLFDEVIFLPDADQIPAAPAEDLVDTHLARCFALLQSELAQRDLPLSVFVHLGSLMRIWDAPLQWRAELGDEDDPPPEAWTAPPPLDPDRQRADPDEIPAIARAFAAQVACLDACLAVLMEDLDIDRMLDSTLLVIGALHAMPLGHHGVIGPAEGHLLSDAIDVPWLIRLPGSSREPGWRAHELIQPSQIMADWLAPHLAGTGSGYLPRPATAATVRVLASGRATAIRTPGWLQVMEGDQRRLVVKPDDRWDVNPVQDRCPAIADLLAETTSQVREALKRGEPTAGFQLAPELLLPAD
jgi:hypothetical protein